MTWRGVFSGALALIALEAVLRSDASADRLGGLFEWVGDLVRSAMSPDVPAIPNLTKAGGFKSGGPSGQTDDPEFSGGGGGGAGGGGSW